MQIEEVKRNLNKMIVYKGRANIYRLTACILRKGNEGYFYQAEILDERHGNSVMICRLEDITATE